ncbi:hypothetical protein [[Flexibacter] sp. ATCC 35208]|uniref:hypothetical protein n=1 Tax=[Flexibacter] sp. ATCC 35208 TaxID=1936242 RepID=UPI0009C4DBD1|nr:hypothetical protein [[Flexibacter] sp. ATCC 35208]OMP76314.1 hypothetical protein BW716_25290 [[Flexibacter] sp. ATCC 35208]
MNVNLQQEKQTILDALDRTRSGVWATAPEIARYSGVDLEMVLRVIYNSREFMQCALRSEDGLPLFTSRKLYKERASYWNKALRTLKHANV